MENLGKFNQSIDSGNRFETITVKQVDAKNFVFENESGEVVKKLRKRYSSVHLVYTDKNGKDKIDLNWGAKIVDGDLFKACFKAGN